MKKLCIHTYISELCKSNSCCCQCVQPRKPNQVLWIHQKMCGVLFIVTLCLAWACRPWNTGGFILSHVSIYFRLHYSDIKIRPGIPAFLACYSYRCQYGSVVILQRNKALQFAVDIRQGQVKT